MKQTLLLVLAILPFFLSAQVLIEIDENPWQGSFEGDLSNNNLEFVAHGKITNVSNQTLNIVWRRLVVDAPAEWDYRICDNNACYPTITGTNYNPPQIAELLTLAPGDTSLLDVHLLPRGVDGPGIVALELKLVEDLTTVIATANYEVEVFNTTSVAEVNVPKLQVYPNPATDFIQLKNGQGIEQVVIFNTIGKQVRTFEVQPNGVYPVADLPNGMYMVSLVAEGRVMKTVRLIKRNIRP